jgi:type I restriction enzyme S subunit
VIEDLKPYPEYKDSGLPWLGKVPAHWGIERAKRLFLKMNRASRPEDDVVTCFRDGTVTLRKKRRTSGYTEAIFEHGYQGVRRGDLVISGMDAFAGAIGVSDSDGKSSPVYSVCLPQEDANSHYYAHLLRRMAHSEWILALAKGIRERSTDFRFDVFGAQRLPLPPVAEQAAIARFLAWASNRLDRAIGAKRRIIALLQDQKQAIIHQAVTRGLDPSVPLKDSGIPWLGKIPEHWEVRRLRTVVKTIDQGVSPLATGFLAEGNSWGVLKSGCVNRGVFRETEHKQLSQSFKIDSSIVVKPGDVLISRACGSPSLVGSVGRVGKLHYNLILSDKTFRPNFEESVDVDFMVLAMNSTYYRRQVEQAISGAEGMANNLPISSLRDFSLAIPPLDEAKAIAFSINKRLAGINLAIASNEQEITLLREYRTRLIADVVTGNLDVREAAAGLPEEIEPPIQSDAAGYDGDEAEDDSDSDPIDTEED